MTKDSVRRNHEEQKTLRGKGIYGGNYFKSLYASEVFLALERIITSLEVNDYEPISIGFYNELIPYI